MDGITHVYTEFIAVGFNEDIMKPVDLFAQADIISVAVTLELIKEFFIECYSSLTEDNQKEVDMAIYKFLEAKGLKEHEASTDSNPE
jgi:hypothetical protein